MAAAEISAIPRSACKSIRGSYGGMGSEALRDLVRAREPAKQDQTRARHRLSKFLLRSGQRPPTGAGCGRGPI